MGIIRASVNRPVTTLMACIAIVLLGSVALSRLSVDLLPDVDLPTISVVTVYEGASPEQIEMLITRPLEQAVASVQGVERLVGESMEGSCQVRVQFTWGTDLDAAMGEVSSRIERLKQSLPEGAEAPYLRRYDLASAPIVYLGLSGDIDPAALTRLAETVVVPRLERVDGVAAATLRGEYLREIQVNLNRDKLAALGMSVSEVTTALQLANQSRPSGNVQRGDLNLLIRGGGEFKSLDDIRNTVVRQAGNALVRIRDIATVIDGQSDLTELTKIDGQPALMLYVNKRSGANTVGVSDGILDAVEDLNQSLRGAQLSVRIDKAQFIRDAIRNVQSAALLGAGLAVLILVIFLHDARSTLVVGVSIPLAVFATFLLMYLQGFTLNIVSFGGLALGIGMLVDNSIVVIESVFRHRELGRGRKEAAVRGTAEVAGAIIASTLTTLIVFLPLIFIQGVTGVLLHQLAWVVSFSLVCSLVTSLTLTPVLAAYWLGGETDGPVHRFFEPIHCFNRRVIGAMESAYVGLLKLTLRYSAVFLVLIMLAGAVSIGLWPRIGTELLPKTDDGDLRTYLVMEPGIRLESLDEQARKIEQTILETVPEATSTVSFIGGDVDDGDEWNEAWFGTTLVRRTDRERSREEIRRALAEAIGEIPGGTVRVTAADDQALGRLFRDSGAGAVAVEIRGYDLDVADRIADEVAEAMGEVPGFVNVEVARENHRPEMAARIDRVKVGAAGLSVSEIAQTLEATVQGVEATVFRVSGEEHPIRVRLRAEDRQGFRDVQQIGLMVPDGRIVPLKNFVDFASDDSPVTIRRLDRQRVVQVTADVDGQDMGTAIRELQPKLMAIPLPDGFSVNIAGDWEEQQESFSSLRIGFLLAILLMYMVMAAQFESLRDPILILASVPFAGIGVIATLIVTGTTLNVQSFIGLVILSGIVVNNAIVLVDYYKLLLQEQRYSDTDTIVLQGALRRFRPIVMTTATTVLAMLPVAFGWGEGGELQAPMARVVVGGLISGTMITLFAIPVLTRWRLQWGESKSVEEDDSPVEGVSTSPVAV